MLNHMRESVIDKMEQSRFMFYLTGSVYFTGNGNDIDYFAIHSTELEDFLKSIGFCSISTNVYGDDNCVIVYRRHSDPYIDVQLVKNAKLKLEIQEIFKKKGILKPTQEQWNCAFLLLGQ